jgi:hypothetical protein
MLVFVFLLCLCAINSRSIRTYIWFMVTFCPTGPNSDLKVRSMQHPNFFALFTVPCSMMAHDYFTFCVQDLNGCMNPCLLRLVLGTRYLKWGNTDDKFARLVGERIFRPNLVVWSKTLFCTCPWFSRITSFPVYVPFYMRILWWYTLGKWSMIDCVTYDDDYNMSHYVS